MTPFLRQLVIENSLPLREIEGVFAIDSTGFSTSRKERWIASLTSTAVTMLVFTPHIK